MPTQPLIHVESAGHQRKNASDPSRLDHRGAPEVQTSARDTFLDREFDRSMPRGHQHQQAVLIAGRGHCDVHSLQVRGDLPAASQRLRLHHEQRIQQVGDLHDGTDYSDDSRFQNISVHAVPIPRTLL